MSYLKTTVVGFLGQDCRLSTVNGKDVINFSVAYSEKFKDAQGTQREKTLWVSANWWVERTAIAQYLKKGTLILAEGIPDIGMYQDKQGKWQAEFKLRVNNVKLLSSGNKENSPQTSNMNTSEVTEPLDDLPF